MEVQVLGFLIVVLPVALIVSVILLWSKKVMKEVDQFDPPAQEEQKEQPELEKPLETPTPTPTLETVKEKVSKAKKTSKKKKAKKKKKG